MGDKLIIHHRDRTKTEVEPLKQWDPRDPEPRPGHTLQKAMEWCKVRGYIKRDHKCDKYWKNTYYFWDLPKTLPPEDVRATDWHTYDPQDEESTALTA